MAYLQKNKKNKQRKLEVQKSDSEGLLKLNNNLLSSQTAISKSGGTKL